MTDIKPYIIFLVLAIISLSLTNLFRKFAIKKKLYNLPNQRSAHEIPTPRIGGIAIIITWYLGIISFYLLGGIANDLFFALLSGLGIACVSIIDDIREVKPSIRFFVQILVSIIAFYFLGGLRGFFIPDIGFDYSYILYPSVIIGMVWFINLFNFMDGIDGFAANEAISISLILFIFSGSIVNLLLIACIAGFLYWNWPKAKIFMGDAGSTQLGFILIVLGIHFHNTLNLSILNWVMIAAPFWFDASYTLYLRWRKGEKITQAHNKHAYQRLVQAGFSHKKVNLILILINLVIFGLIMVYREIYYSLKLPITIFTIVILYFLYKKVNKMVPFN